MHKISSKIDIVLILHYIIYEIQIIIIIIVVVVVEYIIVNIPIY